MIRMPIVLPATAALPNPVRMRTSPIHDAVPTKFWNVAVPEMRTMLRITSRSNFRCDRRIRRRPLPRDRCIS